MISKAIQLDNQTKNKIDFPELNSEPVAKQEEVRTGVSSADLVHAAANGFAMIVRYMLDEGVNPNEQDEFGRTPLSVASTREIHDLLQEAGAIQAA